MFVNPSFSVIKDGLYQSLAASTLSIPPKNLSSSNENASTNLISSGSYNIAFEESPWPNSTIYLYDARYICVSGTQNVVVSGYVTINPPGTTANGTIVFTLPFQSSTPQQGAISSCYASGDFMIPSYAYITNNQVYLHVNVADLGIPISVDRIEYTVSALIKM